jgi:hypothetical protein
MTASLAQQNAQQSVHPTLGILAQFQAFFYASAFFPVGRRPAARPSAGNASRWLASHKIKEDSWLNLRKI